MARRGGGKTRLGAAVTLMELLHKPGVRCGFLAGRWSKAVGCGSIFSRICSTWRRRKSTGVENRRSRLR